MDGKTISKDTADAADLDARLVATLDITAQELLDEIVASIPRPLQPGEITRRMLQARIDMRGRSKSYVQELLKRMVERGELLKRKLPSGEIAYRRAE